MFMKKKRTKPSVKVVKKINKKKVLLASAAALATVALIVGTLLPSAQEVVAPNKIAEPPAMVLNLDEDALVQEESSASEEKKSNRFSDRLRNRLLSLPQSVRIIFVLPLWGLGWVITSFGSLLWAGLFSPLLGFAASWLLSIAVLVGLFAVTVKILFPQIPFRKILSKKNILPMVGIAFVFVALDAVLPLYWEPYATYSVFIKIVIPFSLVGLLVYRLRNTQTEEMS